MALSLGGAASAARIVATVEDDLRTIRGSYEIAGELVDPLARLPEPEDDYTLQRTYPGAPSTGSVEFSEGTFTTSLPRRYGALGALRGGLWANGGWYPQAEELSVQSWTVELSLPEGTVGVINGVAGEGTLSYHGEAARLSIAVVDGRLEELGDGLWLIDRGPRRPRRLEELSLAWEGAFPEGERPESLVVVEAPMHRRLVRPGEGVLYLSSQAFRTPKLLYRFHRGPVGRGLLAAGIEVSGVWEAELAAAVLGAEYQERIEDVELGRLMRLGSFIPLVDYMLYSGRMPFHAEVFDETFPGDSLRDDLVEIFEPRVTGRVLATKLDDAWGAGTAAEVVDDLLDGASLIEAIEGVGIEAGWLDGWARPYPEQDYSLRVRRELVEVEREAPAGSVVEPLVVEVDRQRHVAEIEPGGSFRLERSSLPRRVVLDPEGHVLQTDLAHDRWPARWTTIGTVYPETINLSQRQIVGVATAHLRRQYDTRNVIALTASTDEQDLFGAAVGYHRFFGPLKDRRSRTSRVSIWSAGSWFSPSFASTAQGSYAFGLGAALAHNTRVDYQFPLRGHSFGLSGSSGIVPQSGKTWLSGEARAMKVWAPHPRVALAGQVRGGLASGFVEHRLLSLGGSSALRSIPPGAVLGHQRGLARLELRGRPVKNASVPLLWLYWLDEVQLTGGVEGGWIGQASELDEAGELIDPTLSGTWLRYGATGGVIFTLDGLGVIPWTVGATVGVPLSQIGPPQVYLRLGQEF